MATLITPVATLSHPHLASPQPPMNPTDKAKHSAVFVFPSIESIAELKKAALEVAIEKWGTTKGPTMVKIGGKGSTFRTDVEGKYPEGSVYISARSETQPGLVYRHAAPVVEGEKPKAAKVEQKDIVEVFYPGAQVLGMVVPFAYDKGVNKGIGWALNGVQKYADGERLDGRVKAEDFFTADLSVAPANLAALGLDK
jgi:ssDNA-binding protein